MGYKAAVEILQALGERIHRCMTNGGATTDPLVQEPDPAPRSGSRSDAFAASWELFDQANRAGQQLPNRWNELVGTDLFHTSVFADADGLGRVDVYIDEYENIALTPYRVVRRTSSCCS
jgi:hypothetical protein